MSKNYYFFKIEKMKDPVEKRYYTYLGYYLRRKRTDGSDDEFGRRHPISLYIGRDEIVVYYRSAGDRIRKAFSLHIAEGPVNQGALARKMENYRRMPLWPTSRDITDEHESLYVDPFLLRPGYFVDYYGFEKENNEFVKRDLPGSENNRVEIMEGRRLTIKYNDEPFGVDVWEIDEDGIIQAGKINFTKIFFDFLFELEFTDTFEGENVSRILPLLQNNLVFDSLCKKCRYLTELNKLRDISHKTAAPELPKPFLDVEKEWLNVCRLKYYHSVFDSPDSLFKDPEAAVSDAMFNARVGARRKPRIEYLKKKEDARFKNEISAFFLSKYNIWNAFRVLIPGWGLFFFPLIALFIPLGDFLLSDAGGVYPVGFSTMGVPVLVVGFMLYTYKRDGVNLFKLFLPRLIIGVVAGCVAFWSVEGLLKAALNWKSGVFFFVFMMAIFFVYIFSEIGDRTSDLSQAKARDVFIKTIVFIAASLLISFVMGFYVIQFYTGMQGLKQDFFKDKSLYETPPSDKVVPISIDEFFSEKKIIENKPPEKWELKDDVKYFISKKKNYNSIEIMLPMSSERFCHIRYLWSIHFFQMVFSILVGVVFQMIKEDKPITSPL